MAEISGKRRAARKQKPSKPAAKDERDGDKTAANAEQLLTYVGVARQPQPQSQSQDLRPADPVAWLKAACNDTRAKNRVNDSLEGIFDVKLPPDGPPTIDLHADEWGARR